MDATLSPEESRKAVRKEIWRVTILLTVVTIVELILGFIMMPWPEGSFKRDLMKGVIIILMLVKAFYIVAYFMHLAHEKRNLITVVATPMLLFIWFIIAFLADGHASLKANERYNSYSIDVNKRPAPVHEEGHEGNIHE